MGILRKPVTLQTSRFSENSAAWAQYLMRQPAKFTFGRTSISQDRKGYLIQMDRTAIEGPGAKTGHRGGLVTFGHEVGAHLKDLLAGKSSSEIAKTDEDGTAEALGRQLAQEAPDLSRAEADRLVEVLLRLGQLFQLQETKQPAVNVNSTTNPLTGEEQK
jgi:hypothetical protein